MFRQEDFSFSRAAAMPRPGHVDPQPAGLATDPAPGEGGWHESSWELCNGLEVSEVQGELPEEFVQAPAPCTGS